LQPKRVRFMKQAFFNQMRTQVHVSLVGKTRLTLHGRGRPFNKHRNLTRVTPPIQTYKPGSRDFG
jgi:hypothetical protein